MENLVLVTLHLLAAIFFVGSVFFEVTVLGAIGKPVGARRCGRWKAPSAAARGA